MAPLGLAPALKTGASLTSLIFLGGGVAGDERSDAELEVIEDVAAGEYGDVMDAL